jgi:hypothetical protein
MTFNISAHDRYPPQKTALVDRGLGEANDAAAPLHEVRPLSRFARTEAGRIVGGAVGRWWSQCCKLQQLWVGLHIGVEASEQLLAYTVAYQPKVYPHGIVKYVMVKYARSNQHAA